MANSTPSDTSPATASSNAPRRRSHLERTELSDRLMLDATAALILEVGTQKTTLKEVGEKAGYSRGLANSRFGNKENLFLALADRCREMWLDQVDRAARGKKGLAAIHARIDAITSYAGQHPDSARVMYILWFESVGSQTTMKQGLSRFHEQARRDIHSLVEEAIAADEIPAETNPEDFALHFTSTMFGLAYQWLVNPEAIDIAALADGLKRQIITPLQK